MDEAKKNGLFAKMAAVMGAIGSIGKDGTNDYFKYKYATDGAVYAAVREQLAAHQLAVFASMVDVYQEYDEKGGKQPWRTRAKFEFVIADGESGESQTCVWWAEASDSGDKGINKCATAALKYWLLKTFVIATGDDPDADTPDAPPERRRAASAPKAASVSTRAPNGAQSASESERAPITRADRSTTETDAPHAKELPAAATEQVRMAIGPRIEDLTSLAASLRSRAPADMPEGVKWEQQVYMAAKSELGYEDERAVKAALGVDSIRDWPESIDAMLGKLIDSAPVSAASA